ncbi:MAG TPA: ABC transporter substrate-binding protein [Xanthobacteraceae bacterium]|nr:ABC transporter substrate-binding protein [Xanthobacteraceae bacterium]
MAAIVAALAPLAAGLVHAEDTVKIGLSIPMTGAGFNAVGRQINAAVRLYMAQHGDTVAGKKIELIIRDDGGVADNARRIVQDMIVNDHVAVVGAGITPTALAIAPLVTQAKVATVVMVSGASITVERSPYMVRTGFVLGQSSGIMGQWAAQNGAKRVVTMVNDWAPGLEAETAFKNSFLKGGGQILESIHIPLANPDFAPFLQRIRDIGPDTAFIYFPGTQAGIFAKQFAERGLAQSGIRIIGPGDLTDDDELNTLGDQMLGMITAGQYSALHDSALNKAYVAAFEQANHFRPNFVSLGGYDGMHAIYAALEKTGGATDGDALIAAMKGMRWESPRGMISIDPDTRDIVQNIYLRKVEKVNGELYNVEFQTYEAVKDPLKATKK